MLMSNKILHVKKGAEKACLKRAIELQAVASDPNQKKFFFLTKKKFDPLLKYHTDNAVMKSLQIHEDNKNTNK